MKFPVEQILNLHEMKVLDFQQIEGIGIVITIEKDFNYCTCPDCEQITYSIHQNHWRMIHDLSWSDSTVLLKINRLKVNVINVKKFLVSRLLLLKKIKDILSD